MDGNPLHCGGSRHGLPLFPPSVQEGLPAGHEAKVEACETFPDLAADREPARVAFGLAGKAADGLRTCMGEPIFGILIPLRRFPAIAGARPQKRQGRMGIGAPGVHAEAEGGLERKENRQGKLSLRAPQAPFRRSGPILLRSVPSLHDRTQTPQD